MNLILSGFYALRDVIARAKGGLSSLPSFGLSGLLIALGVAALVAAVVALALRWRRRPSLFDLLSKRLSKQGLSIAPSMTGADVIALVRSARPAIAPVVERIVTLYERDRFSARPITHEERTAAKMELRELRSSAKGHRS